MSNPDLGQHRYIWPYLQGKLNKEHTDDLFMFFLSNPEWFHRTERIKQRFGGRLKLLCRLPQKLGQLKVECSV